MRKIIAVGDLHLRDDTPVCRTDDYMEAMVSKMKFLRSFEDEKTVFVFPGDVFHKWKSSPYLLSLAIETFPKNSIAVAGNHDLPGHNADRLCQSSLNVLNSANRIDIIRDPIVLSDGVIFRGFWEGDELEFTWEEDGEPNDYLKVAIAHTMVWSKEKPYPDVEPEANVKNVMKKLKGFDLIVTGDNHKNFIVETSTQTLINAGSVMRMTADQKDHKPSIYEYDIESRTYKEHCFPIKRSVVSSAHIDKKKDKDSRIESFVKSLSKDMKVTISFEDNLRSYMAKNKVSSIIKKKVMETIK